MSNFSTDTESISTFLDDMEHKIGNSFYSEVEPASFNQKMDNLINGGEFNYRNYREYYKSFNNNPTKTNEWINRLSLKLEPVNSPSKLSHLLSESSEELFGGNSEVHNEPKISNQVDWNGITYSDPNYKAITKDKHSRMSDKELRYRIKSSENKSSDKSHHHKLHISLTKSPIKSSNKSSDKSSKSKTSSEKLKEDINRELNLENLLDLHSNSMSNKSDKSNKSTERSASGFKDDFIFSPSQL